MKREHALKLRQMIVKAAASLDDTDALAAKELYDLWNDHSRYYIGDRRREDNRLFRCLQEHDSQPLYKPSLTPALWEEIADPGTGTKDNPIKYNNNMALEKDKYYTQYDVLYICTRSTINPVYNPLSELVGLYVQIVED